MNYIKIELVIKLLDLMLALVLSILFNKDLKKNRNIDKYTNIFFIIILLFIIFVAFASNYNETIYGRVCIFVIFPTLFVFNMIKYKSSELSKKTSHENKYYIATFLFFVLYLTIVTIN